VAQRLSPDLYDRDSFLSRACEGADDFHAGHGLSPLIRAVAVR